MSQVQMGLGYVDLQARGSAAFAASMNNASASTGKLSTSLNALQGSADSGLGGLIKLSAAVSAVNAAGKLGQAAIASLTGDTEALVSALYTLPLGVGPAVKSIADLAKAFDAYTVNGKKTIDVTDGVEDSFNRAFGKGQVQATIMTQKVMDLQKATELLRQSLDSTSFDRMKSRRDTLSQSGADVQDQIKQAKENAQKEIDVLQGQKVGILSAGLDSNFQQRINATYDRNIAKIKEGLKNTIQDLQKGQSDLGSSLLEFDAAKADEEYKKMRDKNKTETQALLDEAAEIRTRAQGKELDADMSAIKRREEEAINSARAEFAKREGFETQLAEREKAIRTKADAEREAAAKKQEARDKQVSDKKAKEEKDAADKEQEYQKKLRESYDKSLDSALNASVKRDEAEKKLSDAMAAREKERGKFVDVGGKSSAEGLFDDTQKALLQTMDPKMDEAIAVAKQQLEAAVKTEDAAIRSAQALEEIVDKIGQPALIGE